VLIEELTHDFISGILVSREVDAFDASGDILIGKLNAVIPGVYARRVWSTRHLAESEVPCRQVDLAPE
jgi:hypothetical protein